MYLILVTREVSKFDTSPLNKVALANMAFILVTLEVLKFDKS